MRELGDIVKLNKKKSNSPMCPQGKEWDKFITYKIIINYDNGTYLARNGFDREELIFEEDIIKSGEI
jgi:hypothetical protein